MGQLAVMIMRSGGVNLQVLLLAVVSTGMYASSWDRRDRNRKPETATCVAGVLQLQPTRP